MRIYMAGALFSTAECNFNSDLAAQLRIHGHEVFLPQENEQGNDPKKIFKSDVDGIDWAEMVLANLDGPDPDSGTCWELGYGYAKGKYIAVYRTDFRLFEGPDQINLMLTESANLVFTVPKMSVSMLAEVLDRNIRDRWPTPKINDGDQFGGFKPDKIGEPLYYDEGHHPFTPIYRHADK